MENTNIELETYRIQTAMGKLYFSELPFLTKEQVEDFNEIGYTGKLKGQRISRQDYLNSLNLGKFQVLQTKFDNGEFMEAFTITRAYIK